MKKRIFISSFTLIVVFVIHAGYTIIKTMNIANKWVNSGGQNFFKNYFVNQDYITGLSLALAISFTVYAIMKYIDSRKKSAKGILGGITLTGFLSFGLCFLLGCCGSPMLVVYLGLFGTAFIGFLKPLFLALTIVSVAVGVVLLERKKNKVCTTNCACNDAPSKDEVFNEK